MDQSAQDDVSIPIWEQERSRLQAAYLGIGRFQRIRAYLSIAAFWILGGWLMGREGWSSGYRGATLRLVLFVVRYLVTWTIAMFVIWMTEPHLLVASRAGVETALGVLPATIVAVLVLLLGSVAVLAQMAAAAWGTRAPLVLTLDDRLQNAVLRPLLLVVVVLLLAGQVPDAPSEPSDLLTATIAALLLATIWMTLRSTVLPAVVVQAIAPRSFPQLVLAPIDRELGDGSTGLVVLRGPLLGEMLRVSLTREDSVAVRATLEAMVNFQAKYLLALTERDEIRAHQDAVEGVDRESWLASDLTLGLVNAAERALRDIASAEDTNAISNTLAALAYNFIEARQYGDAMIAVDGLINLGTSAHASICLRRNQLPRSTTREPGQPGGAPRSRARAADLLRGRVGGSLRSRWLGPGRRLSRVSLRGLAAPHADIRGRKAKCSAALGRGAAPRRTQ